MIEKAIEALKTYDWGVDASVLKPIDEAINASYGDAAARSEIEAQLVPLLDAGLSYDASNMICRYLRTIGGDACIASLGKLLGDEKLSHSARYALERIPGEEAASTLRDALGSVSNPLKVGVMSSLGVRQDSSSAPALGKLLSDSDGAVALAAARALGAIRSAEAATALADSQPHEEAKAATVDAQLACAESMLAAGEKKAALATYKGLLKLAGAKHVKLAVSRGMLACAKLGG